MKLRAIKTSGQTGLEYLLLFGVVAMMVLWACHSLLPQVRLSSEGYYNNVATVILDDNLPIKK